MQRQPVITKDGSHTISVTDMNVTYHSHYGAIQESMHVFIDMGYNEALKYSRDKPLTIFEMGFGTGLNAFLTLIEAEKSQQTVHYTAIELFPLQHEEIMPLNYCRQLNREDLNVVFQELHKCEWGKEITITPFFTLHKKRDSLLNFKIPKLKNLIYFDAFAPSAQPELWTQLIFENLYSMLSPGGMLVTYCSKGDVRRAMQAVGFVVEKIPGPPGKREMIRAVKRL